jgi:hypothetical protein
VHEICQTHEREHLGFQQPRARRCFSFYLPLRGTVLVFQDLNWQEKRLR